MKRIRRRKCIKRRLAEFKPIDEKINETIETQQEVIEEKVEELVEPIVIREVNEEEKEKIWEEWLNDPEVEEEEMEIIEEAIEVVVEEDIELTEEDKKELEKIEKLQGEEREKALKKFKDARRKVTCINTGITYENSRVASEETGANASAITRNCNGNCKSAGKDKDGKKLKWKYADEE